MSKKVKKGYYLGQETPEQHAERVRNECGRFRARVEKPKNLYTRKQKHKLKGEY